MSAPDSLPTLSKGSHAPHSGNACVMEYVSLLAGEDWSDTPSCTHPILARVAHRVNDNLSDDQRHLLVPLIGRLFGTSEGSRDVDISMRLTMWLIRHAAELMGRAGQYDQKLAQVELLVQKITSRNYSQVRSESRLISATLQDNVDPIDGAIHPIVHAFLLKSAWNDIDDARLSSFLPSAAVVMIGLVQFFGFSTDFLPPDRSVLVDVLSDLIDEYDRLTGRMEHRVITSSDISLMKGVQDRKLVV